MSLVFETDFGVEKTRLLFPIFTTVNVNVFSTTLVSALWKIEKSQINAQKT